MVKMQTIINKVHCQNSQIHNDRFELRGFFVWDKLVFKSCFQVVNLKTEVKFCVYHDSLLDGVVNFDI